jgi:hypothetical protein
MLKKIKRRILVAAGLYFDYEVSPHRRFLTQPGKAKQSAAQNGIVGKYFPFKQSRLAGQGNPLRPPFHLETVLIGRALGQQTGYLYGVGFRVQNDGYVEAEFESGVRKFDTYDQFKTKVTELVRRNDRPDGEAA